MLTEEQIAEITSKHPGSQHFRSKRGKWECILRPPKRAEYKRFKHQTHNPATAADAQEMLVRQCVVYPDRVVFDALLEEYPAIPEALSKPLLDMLEMELEGDLK